MATACRHYNLRAIAPGPSAFPLRGRASSKCLHSRKNLQVVCVVRARWCLDVNFGYKQEATSLLQEWVSTVGSSAGLNSSNTRLSSGAIGVPESRLEVECTFNNAAEFEQFLSKIPFKEHKAWSQRIQKMVVNGSPKWEVYRMVPIEMDGSSSTSTSTTSSTSRGSKTTSTAPLTASPTDSTSIATNNSSLVSSWTTPQVASPSDSQDNAQKKLHIIDDTQDAQTVLDWKGDPMVLNPGDKLPFKFL